MFSSRSNWKLEPNRFARALEAHRRSGKTMLDLTASNPTNCGFVYPEREILAALADPRALEYKPESKGLVETRAAVAEYYASRPSFSRAAHGVNPERLVLTSGTSEAYSHVFRLLCEPGDEVLVPAPSYPLLEFLAGLADVRLVAYPLLYDHRWQVDLGGLRAVLTPRSRAVVVVHPNNPTGSFVKPSEAEELAAICIEKQLTIMADEVFLDYADAAESAASFAPGSGALTLTLSGLSKISALPQMKLAWIVASGPQAQAQEAVKRLEIIADTYLSPSTPVQLAAGIFLALRGGMQSQIQERVAANLAFLDGKLREFPGVTRLQREGGWYAVLRVPVSGSDEALAVELMERCSVLVHPGMFFNFAQEGYLVISLIAPTADFREGIRRIGEFFTSKG
ncbi:MAG TPA: pyridoxal phosphate-dependent aminotransferase [Methylomirabilota bacterium]|nr:pyridoxal phosphate-dependent aminotransferase [Methylomirabilota bacterium]